MTPFNLLDNSLTIFINPFQLLQGHLRGNIFRAPQANPSPRARSPPRLRSNRDLAPSKGLREVSREDRRSSHPPINPKNHRQQDQIHQNPPNPNKGPDFDLPLFNSRPEIHKIPDKNLQKTGEDPNNEFFREFFGLQCFRF